MSCATGGQANYVAMATNLNINNAPALSYLANINNLSIINLLVPVPVPNPSSAPLGSPLQGCRTVYFGRAPRHDGRSRPPRQYAEAAFLRQYIR